MSILATLGSMLGLGTQGFVINVINLVLGVGSVASIVAFLIPKLEKAKAVANEFQELIGEIVKAQADGTITAEEITGITASGKDFLEAIKALISKNKELKRSKK
jgi:pentose-5-phosphate-3-epimerase